MLLDNNILWAAFVLIVYLHFYFILLTVVKSCVLCSVSGSCCDNCCINRKFKYSGFSDPLNTKVHFNMFLGVDFSRNLVTDEQSPHLISPIK